MKCAHALPLFLLLFAACGGSGNPALPGEKPSTSTAQHDSTATPTDTTKAAAEQVSQYIRRIFQDRDGNIWFGTTSDGAVRYDGRSLDYFGAPEGLSDWVSSMAQDEQGDLWFGTHDGVFRYDPSTSLRAGSMRFTRYTTKDGLASDQVWCVLLERSGGFWVATEGGVSRFDPSAPPRAGGRAFTPFPIPAADLSHFPNYENPKQINWITEDRSGNIWFASNGGGAYMWNGKTLTNLSEKDGLCNNFVQTMMQDRAGNMWFGTRFGGACKYDPSSSLRAGGAAPDKSGRGGFTSFGRKELHGDNVFTLYQDPGGIIWIGVTAYGLCNYDGTNFVCYNEADGAGIRVIMSTLEDANGQLWFGTGAGLYRFNGGKFTNFTKEELLGPGSR